MRVEPLVSIIIPTYNRKETLTRLIESILKNNYPKDKLEIIVIDDLSTDGTYEEVNKRFPEIKVIRDKKLFTTGSRNIGIRNAKGKYIFLIDDDNFISPNTIRELVIVFEDRNNLSIGVVAPIMYYLKNPKLIWCAGIDRNMITSLTTKRVRIDRSQFNELINSKDFPNAFMIRKEVIERVGLLDEKVFPVQFEEADFGERVRRSGYKIVCNPKAEIWHDIPPPEEVKDRARLLHCHTELRAYYCARNRIIFHKKYSKLWQFLVFILVFNWLVTMYYIKTILFNSESPYKERINIAKGYLKGVLSGLNWRKSS